MYSIILDVHTGSREEYITSKIRRSAESILEPERLRGADFLEPLTAGLLGARESQSVSTAEEHEFHEIDSRQRFDLDVARRCAMMEVAVSAPLVEGEEVEEDLFTYLTEPFGDFAPYTGVLRRRTNMAELLYIFENVRIDQGNLVYLVKEVDQGGVESMAPSALLGDKMGDLIKSLLSKAAGAAGGKIGALIFNLVVKEIFGTDDNAKFVEAVQKVIRDEIDSAEIDKINGRVQGTIQYLTNDYQVRKAKSDLKNVEERKELLTSLEKYSQQFYTEVMGVLEQTRYAEKGLRAYMLGASIHLIITQEMALVDWKTMDPNESSYAATLRINAKHYRERVEGTFKPMYDRRMAKISWGYTPDKICDRIGCRDSRKAWAWWDEEDHSSEKFYEDQHKKGTSAKDLAEQGCNRRRGNISYQFSQDAGDPLNNAVPHLKALETNRIPG